MVKEKSPLEGYEAMKMARRMSIRESKWRSFGLIGLLAVKKKTGAAKKSRNRPNKGKRA